MWKYLKKYRNLITVALVLGAWITALFFISPEEIVAQIGIEGGYALVFFTALIGISSFTSTSFYATLIILASTGEFNPFLLALAAAPAAALGDSLFFLLGLKSRSLLTERHLNAFSHWLEKAPGWLPPIVAYFYTGFTPLPQDFLMIALGIAGVRFWKIFIAILLGNATLVIVISYLTTIGAL